MIIRVFLFPTMSKSWEFEGRKECGVNRNQDLEMSFNAKNLTVSREAVQFFALKLISINLGILVTPHSFLSFKRSRGKVRRRSQTIEQYSSMGLTRVLYNVIGVEGGQCL